MPLACIRQTCRGAMARYMAVFDLHSHRFERRGRQNTALWEESSFVGFQPDEFSSDLNLFRIFLYEKLLSELHGHWVELRFKLALLHVISLLSTHKHLLPASSLTVSWRRSYFIQALQATCGCRDRIVCIANPVNRNIAVDVNVNDGAQKQFALLWYNARLHTNRFKKANSLSNNWQRFWC